MFAVLETAGPRYSGIFGGVLNILFKKRPHVETREAFGTVYSAVIAEKPASDSDWHRIAEAAGRCRSTMLFPKGMSPPPPLRELKCPGFEKRLMLGTAIEIIKRTRMPMYRRIAGLVDENGEYADFLFELLHHYTTVKVLSPRRGLYEAHAESMMEKLGAPVVLCDDYASLSDCVLIIAPEGITTDSRLACPVLGKPGATRQRGEFITGLRYVPSAEQAKLCPPGIEPHDFFAALYEYGGVKDIGSFASRMTFRCVDTGLTQVVYAVMKASGGLTLF